MVSPYSDVVWLELHRYCCVPVAAKVTSYDAFFHEDGVTNVAVARHSRPTWTGAIRGTVPEAEIIGAAAYLLHTPPSDLTVHVVDASIIGAQLRRAQEALYRGIKGPTPTSSTSTLLTRWWKGGVGCHAELEDPITGWYGRARTCRRSCWRSGFRRGSRKGPASTPHVAQGTRNPPGAQ